MLKNLPPVTLYVSIIILSLILIISSDRWIIGWVTIEIALIGFIPIFSIDEKITGQALSSYFIIQAGGSAIFIVGNLLTIEPINVIVIQLRLGVKLGLFPFQQWVPTCLNSITWEGAIILVTLQKAPVLLIIFIIEEDLEDLQKIAIFRIGPIAILAYNQSQLRRLIAYSSVIHTSWLLLALQEDTELGLIYAIYYFSLTFILFISFRVNQTDDNIESKYKNLYDEQILFILILTGLPPFAIFLLKVLILNTLNERIFVVYILLRTFIARYYYFALLTPKLIKTIISENRTALGGLLFYSLPVLLLYF